jgi:hypothetical protein
MGPGSACGRGRGEPGSREGARLAEAGGVRRGPDGKNRGGREATDRWGPITVLAIQIKSNRSKTLQTNLNSKQTHSNFILSKLDLHKLKKFEIKYCFEGFDERNNFFQRSLSIFDMDFKLKFRESNV